MTNDEFRVLPLESTGTGGQQWEDSGSTVTRSVLDNGLRIITQKIPATRSLALSWWVGAGSRDEDQDSAGSTHFLEHLLFKGTARRSAFDIAQAFDAVGGESNAETGKEHTNYWARVLSDDTAMAIDVLGDMISGSLIDPDEFETNAASFWMNSRCQRTTLPRLFTRHTNWQFLVITHWGGPWGEAKRP